MAVPEVPVFDANVITTTDLNALGEAVTFLQDRPLVQLRQTVSQNVTTSTFTALTFTTEDVDTDDGHDTGSNTSRYVAPEDGWYRCSGAFNFESNATGVRVSRWAKNGTEINGGRTDHPAISGAQVAYNARTIDISLSAGDYVELQVWQNSGGTRATVVTADVQAHVTIVWDRRL